MSVHEFAQNIWKDCRVELLEDNHIKVTRQDGTSEISAGKLVKYLKWSMVNVHKIKVTE
jgi:hypothetical protein